MTIEQWGVVVGIVGTLGAPLLYVLRVVQRIDTTLNGPTLGVVARLNTVGKRAHEALARASSAQGEVTALAGRVGSLERWRESEERENDRRHFHRGEES